MMHHFWRVVQQKNGSEQEALYLAKTQAEQPKDTPMDNMLKAFFDSVNNMSMIIDENGEPLLVSHYTEEEFSTFELNDAPFLEGRSAIALVVYRGGAYNITHRSCDPNGCCQE